MSVFGTVPDTSGGISISPSGRSAMLIAWADTREGLPPRYRICVEALNGCDLIGKESAYVCVAAF